MTSPQYPHSTSSKWIPKILKKKEPNYSDSQLKSNTSKDYNSLARNRRSSMTNSNFKDPISSVELIDHPSKSRNSKGLEANPAAKNTLSNLVPASSSSSYCADATPTSGSSKNSNNMICDSCKCCGTLLIYPSKVFKIKCLVCKTYFVIDISLIEDSSLKTDEAKSLPPMSYRLLKDVIKNCESNNADKGKKDLHLIFKPVEDTVFIAFSNFNILNKSFILDSEKEPTYNSPNLNFNEIKKFYSLLQNLPTKRPMFKLLLGGLHLLRHPPIVKDFKQISWILIILECPLLIQSLIGTSNNQLMNPELKSVCYDIIKRIIGFISYLDKSTNQYLCHWWSRLPKPEFLKKVEFFNLYITFHLTRFINHEFFSTVIKPGAYLSNDSTSDDVNYKDSLNTKIIRPASESTDFGLSIGLPSCITSGSRRGSDVAFNNNPESSYWSPNNNIEKEHNIKIKIQQYSDDWHLRTACRTMSYFFFANKKHSKIPNSCFYNSLVDYINVKQDFDTWQFNLNATKHENDSKNPNHDPNLLVIDYLKAQTNASYLGISTNGPVIKRANFTFCSFPFLLSLGAKITILEHEAKRSMERKAEEAFIQSLNHKTSFDVYFKIKIRRSHITSDSLKVIKSHPNDFRKLIRVEFIDEPGIDAGGLRKEWFLLLTKELFDPNKGLFTVYKESNLCYFAISNMNNDELFYLVGVVLGCAIYNSTILDLKLPIGLYNKIMGRKVTLDDFIQLNPSSGINLKKLIKMKGVEQLGIYFEVTYKDIFGTIFTKELCNNGSNILVNDSNKSDYILRYYNFMMNDLVSNQFNQFNRGFHQVVGGNALSLFTPEEIQLLLIGDDNENKIDIEILKSITKYNGCDLTDLTVQWFWEYFDNLTINSQKKLLLFVTGSDRLPATGLPSLNFKISKLFNKENKTSNQRLPISHTCFNEVCLYDYETQDIFNRKMEMAIFNSKGFGLR